MSSPEGVDDQGHGGVRPPTPPDPSGNLVGLPTWKASLEYRVNTKTGERMLTPSLINATLILMHDRAFAGCWSRDLFSGSVLLMKDLPAVAGLDPVEVKSPVPVQDYHVSYIILAMSALIGVSLSRDIAAAAIEAAASQRPHNALTDWLDGLVWDGVKRLDSWLMDYLGADDSPYTRSVGRWWLVSAMARGYRPGCQADHMLVLEGPQGTGKSTAASILGGEHYLRKLPNVRDYDRAAHALSGRWLVEVGELDALRGAASSQVKDFLTLTFDHYRPPYGRYHIEQQRTCVFIGTTNEGEYLQDASGGRRFWPVKVRQLDRALMEAERDQLLAEARDAFKAGERWWPKSTDAVAKAVATAQDDRQQGDEYEALVSTWLETGTTDGGRVSVPFQKVTMSEILGGAIKLDPSKWDPAVQRRIGIVMGKLGWSGERKRDPRTGARERVYYRPAPERQPEPEQVSLGLDGLPLDYDPNER